MRVTVIGRRGRCFERIAVVMRRRDRFLDGIMIVMVDVQMLPRPAWRQVVDGVAYLHHAREGAVEREDQRQEEGEKQSHCRRF